MSAIGNPRITPVQTPVQAPPQTPPPPAPHPVEPRPSSRGRYAVFALLLIGGVLAWQYLRTPDTALNTPDLTIRTAAVTTGTLQKTIRVNGQTSSREFNNITAPISRGIEAGREMILLFLIPSGTRVKKGDMLASIDMKAVEDHIDDVKDDVEKSEADIRKRKAEQSIDYENLEQTIRVAKSALDKAKLDQRAGETRTPVDQELLKLAVEEAEAAYKQAQADVQYKKVSQEADLKILGFTRLRHVNHLGRHTADTEKYTMRASMDGLAVVQQTYRNGEASLIQQGDQVFPGQLFLKVVRPDRMQVEGLINQSESDQFRIGQSCKILFDAFPGMTFSGKIYSIGAMAVSGSRQQNNFIRNVPVKIAIDGADLRLIPDLSASADVVIAEEANVKQIPLAAVFTEKGKEIVFVKTGAKFERREVTLGLRNATHAAVVSGLQDGEQVALSRPQGS